MREMQQAQQLRPDHLLQEKPHIFNVLPTLQQVQQAQQVFSDVCEGSNKKSLSDTGCTGCACCIYHNELNSRKIQRNNQPVPTCCATGCASPPRASAIKNARLAEDLVRLGFAVFPCDPSADPKKAKRPLISRGHLAASSDLAVVRGWWRRWPDALVGLPCDRFWVLDLDNRASEGWPFQRVLAGIAGRLRRELTWLADTSGLLVETPSGGLHGYYSRVPGVEIRNAASEISQHVDTRGHDEHGRPKGYVIAPGVQLRDGRQYRIVKGSLSQLGPAPLGLTYLATFSPRDLEVIAATSVLREQIASAPPQEWRGLVDAAMRRRALVMIKSLAPPSAADGMRRQALHDIDDAARRLASLTDGRSRAAYRLAAAVGKYVRHGIVAESEVVAPLLNAWVACGGATKRGLEYGRRQVRQGLQAAAGDPLPPLSRNFR